MSSSIALYVIINLLWIPGAAFAIYSNLALERARRWTWGRCAALIAISILFPGIGIALFLNLQAWLGVFGAASPGLLFFGAILLCSSATAACLTWATGSKLVGRRTHIAGGIAATLALPFSFSGALGPFGPILALLLLLAAAIVWHAIVATTLSRWAYNTLAHAIDHCAECGYDLKGLRSKTCPECGAAIRAPAKSGRR